MFSFLKPKPSADPPAPMASTPSVEAPTLAKPGWAARLRAGLAKTRAQLNAVFGAIKVDEALFEELEYALIAADCGVDAARSLITALRDRARREQIEDGETLKRALAELIAGLLAPLQKPPDLDRAKPLILMIAGVNGVGKTTSIGKLAKYFQTHGKSVLLAAGDTFRAAAREQLTTWGERNNVTVVAHGADKGGDPSAVIFDAVHATRARGIDILMADTAGRLPTQKHLMDEIRKIRRAITNYRSTQYNSQYCNLNNSRVTCCVHMTRLFLYGDDTACALSTVD